jgi:hypothetical protein
MISPPTVEEVNGNSEKRSNLFVLREDRRGFMDG